MLVNVSYNNKEITKKIDAEVGRSYSLLQRIKMKGIGSPKLIITTTSEEIQRLLMLDSNRNVCNIELRPKGIILGFRSLLESYALVIPYYKLNVYKGKSEEYSIYRDHHYVKVEARQKSVHAFFKRIMDLKSDNLPLTIEDL